MYDTYYAEADIFAVTGLMSASGVTGFGVGVDVWTDPFSYDWEYGYTGPLWDIDVDGDDDYEYYTGIVNVDGSVGGVLLDSADQFVCEVGVDWSPPAGAYMVGFPTACLGANLPQIRMRAAFLYDDVVGGYYDVDYAPDYGWSAPIHNDAYIPPVTPPTPPVTPPHTARSGVDDTRHCPAVPAVRLALEWRRAVRRLGHRGPGDRSRRRTDRGSDGRAERDRRQPCRAPGS